MVTALKDSGDFMVGALKSAVVTKFMTGSQHSAKGVGKLWAKRARARLADKKRVEEVSTPARGDSPAAGSATHVSAVEAKAVSVMAEQMPRLAESVKNVESKLQRLDDLMVKMEMIEKLMRANK